MLNNPLKMCFFGIEYLHKSSCSLFMVCYHRRVQTFGCSICMNENVTDIQSLVQKRFRYVPYVFQMSNNMNNGFIRVFLQRGRVVLKPGFIIQQYGHQFYLQNACFIHHVVFLLARVAAYCVTKHESRVERVHEK